MIHSFLLLSLLQVSAVDAPFDITLAPAQSARVESQTPVPPKDDGEYEKRKKEAGKDTTKLWKVYEWCKLLKKDKEGKATLKEILKIDPMHKDANVASGNIFFEGQWFANQKKIDEFKKEKEVKEKKEKGLVEFKGEWVPKEDLPFLEKGMVRDETGNWVDAEEAKKVKEGWVKQDLDWIPADQKENIAKGLWKCGDKWLPIAEADKYHTELEQWWRLPCDRYTLLTTCDRDVALQKVKRQLDFAIDDLEKIYNVKLSLPISVVILRSADQYSSYAAGDQDVGRGTTDALGLSSIHYAYFADVSFDPETKQFLSAGVGYWDASSDTGNKWGVHSVRHALGLSFAEALDPSPKTIESVKKTGKFDLKKFYEEKKFPRWFRYGAAAYVERYYNDTTVGIGGNMHWAKEWSVKNILSQGGLRPLKQLFEFNLRSEAAADATKLINESGLVTAFIVDGKCAAVTEKFKAVQEAIKAGKDKKATAEAFTALEAEVIKNEAELRKFAGI